MMKFNLCTTRRRLAVLLVPLCLAISSPVWAQDEAVQQTAEPLAVEAVSEEQQLPEAAEAAIAGQGVSDNSVVQENGAVDPSVSKPIEARTESQVDISQEPVLPHNLSPWGMFVAADNVVKAVMVILALASLLTWTVLLAKSIELRGLRRLLQHNLAKIVQAHTLAEAANADGIAGVGRALIEAAEKELQLSSELVKEDSSQEAIKGGIKERTVSNLSRLEVGFGRRLLIGTGLLATIGAVAPFVGLFGTVWGIMNSFIGISKANTTNLAVVAPGIAEALLATALGLVAAIPAVVIYNHFTRQIAGIKALAADCSAAIMRLVSRDLDRGTSLCLVNPPRQKAE